MNAKKTNADEMLEGILLNFSEIESSIKKEKEKTREERESILDKKVKIDILIKKIQDNLFDLERKKERFLYAPFGKNTSKELIDVNNLLCDMAAECEIEVKISSELSRNKEIDCHILFHEIMCCLGEYTKTLVDNDNNINILDKLKLVENTKGVKTKIVDEFNKSIEVSKGYEDDLCYINNCIADLNNTSKILNHRINDLHNSKMPFRRKIVAVEKTVIELVVCSNRIIKAGLRVNDRDMSGILDNILNMVTDVKKQLYEVKNEQQDQ